LAEVNVVWYYFYMGSTVDQRPVQKLNTDILKHNKGWQARLLSEYIPPICTAAVICSCLGLSEFSTRVSDKQPRLRTRLFCPLPSTKFHCHLLATLNLGLESSASQALRTGYFGYTSEIPVLRPWPRFPNCRDVLLQSTVACTSTMY
jgi:hypothetical protein